MKTNRQADVLSSVDDLARVLESRREQLKTSGLADRPAVDPVTSVDIVTVLKQLPDTYLERTQEIYELLGVPHDPAAGFSILAVKVVGSLSVLAIA
jgi:hypothetical protein